MAVQDMAFNNTHNKFVERRLKQLGLSDEGMAPETSRRPPAGPSAISGKKNAKNAKEAAKAQKPRGKGRAFLPAPPSESVYALLGSTGSSGMNLAGSTAPMGRSVTPAYEPGHSSSSSPLPGRGPGGHKGGSPMGHMAGRRPSSDGGLGTSAVLALSDKLNGQGRFSNPDAVAMSIAPGYATSLSPRALAEMDGRGRSGPPKMQGTANERLGYAARDAQAFPMGGAGGAKGKGSNPFGAPDSPADAKKVAVKSRKELQKAEELRKEMEALQAEEAAVAGARNAKARAQAAYARELEVQAAKQKEAKDRERSLRLAPYTTGAAGMAAELQGGGGEAGPVSSLQVVPPTDPAFVFGKRSRAAGEFSPFARGAQAAAQAAMQGSPHASAPRDAEPASYSSYNDEEGGGSARERGPGGAVLTALRNSVSTLQTQCARLRDENSRLETDLANARITTRHADAEAVRVTAKLSQAVDLLDRYVEKYGPLRG